jgi:replicative DNA helicase
MHHEEYEKNIIGCFLEHGSLIDTFPQLQSEHFYSDRLAMVHEAMMKLRSQDVPIDEITVRRYMKEKGLLDKFVGFDFV